MVLGAYTSPANSVWSLRAFYDRKLLECVAYLLFPFPFSTNEPPEAQQLETQVLFRQIVF